VAHAQVKRKLIPKKVDGDRRNRITPNAKDCGRRGTCLDDRDEALKLAKKGHGQPSQNGNYQNDRVERLILVAQSTAVPVGSKRACSWND
jgi:hypothetical protein